MTQLTLESLERRVAALEYGMALWLRPEQQRGEWKDWRNAIGKFVPSELTEEIDAAGREIREADRRQVTP